MVPATTNWSWVGRMAVTRVTVPTNSAPSEPSTNAYASVREMIRSISYRRYRVIAIMIVTGHIVVAMLSQMAKVTLPGSTPSTSMTG